MDIMDKLENFIRERNLEAAHMLRTPFWLKEIYPEADDVMLLAALCHDIERCFPLRVGEVKPEKTGDDAKDVAYLKWHGNRSAEFAENILREYGLDDEAGLARIKTLIAEHSFSGTKEREAMMDADSLSFFENNAEMIIKKFEDKERLKNKFDSEFKRIFSDRARQLARPLYDNAIEKLNL